MKIKTTKGVKTCLLALAGAFLIGCIGGAIYTVNIKNTVEEQHKIYTYDTSGGSDYVVNLNPNILYGEIAQQEGETYLSAFVKNITASLNYKVEGSKELQWKGEYTVEADTRAFVNNQDQKNIIWNRIDTLIPSKVINTSAELIEVGEQVTIDFNKYNLFATQVTELSKVNANTELEVRLVGSISTEVEGNKLTVPIRTSMIIPLQTSYFNIREVEKELSSEEVTTQFITQLPPDKGILIVCIGGAILGVMALIGINMGIGIKEVGAKWEKERDRIKREHGSRMVAVANGIEVNTKQLYELISIEDLVKVADEMQRPILYPVDQSEVENAYFYVETDEKYYNYRINIRRARI